jgi:hypothetical protein
MKEPARIRKKDVVINSPVACGSLTKSLVRTFANPRVAIEANKAT